MRQNVDTNMEDRAPFSEAEEYLNQKGYRLPVQGVRPKPNAIVRVVYHLQEDCYLVTNPYDNQTVIFGKKPDPQEASVLLHRLWTRAAKHPEYDKKEWMRLQELMQKAGLPV